MPLALFLAYMFITTFAGMFGKCHISANRIHSCIIFGIDIGKWMLNSPLLLTFVQWNFLLPWLTIGAVIEFGSNAVSKRK